MCTMEFTCYGDDEGSIHGTDSQGPGPGRQVEIGDEVGQLTEDQRPGVDAEERVPQQGEVQHFGFLDGHLTSRRAGMGRIPHNGRPVNAAIDLCGAVWAPWFTLSRVMVGFMVTIDAIQDQFGQFRVRGVVLGDRGTLSH